MTISDPEHVVKLLEKRSWVPCCYLRLRFWCCKKKYKLLEAPMDLDINWSNIGFQTFARNFLLILIFFINILCLFYLNGGLEVLFSIKFVLTTLMKSKIGSFAMTCISIILWIIFKIFKMFFDYLLKLTLGFGPYLSKAKFLASLTFRNSIFRLIYFYVMVSSGWSFSKEIVDPVEREAYLHHLTWVIINYMVLSQIVVSTLKRYFGGFRIKRYCKKKKIMEKYKKKGEELNIILKKPVKLTKDDLLTQKELNRLFELPEWAISEHYSVVLTNLLIGVTSGVAAPAITMGCLVISIFNSLVDKWIIYYKLKQYRSKTQHLNSEIAGCNVTIIKFISFVILGFNLFYFVIFCVLDKKKTSALFSYSTFFHLGIIFTPFNVVEYVLFRVISRLFGLDCTLKLPKFEKIEGYLMSDYDRENPMTAHEARAEWREKYQSRLFGS